MQSCIIDQGSESDDLGFCRHDNLMLPVVVHKGFRPCTMVVQCCCPIHCQKCDRAKACAKISRPMDNAVVLMNAMHKPVHGSVLVKDVRKCSEDSVAIVQSAARLPKIKTQ